MRSIVFNPDWTVPETIKFEDLAPRLRQGSADGGPDLSVLSQQQALGQPSGQAGRCRDRRLEPREVQPIHLHAGARAGQCARRAQVQFSQPARHLHARHHPARAVPPDRAHAEPWLHPREPAGPAGRAPARRGQRLVGAAGEGHARQGQEQRGVVEQARAGASHLFHRRVRRAGQAADLTPTSMGSTRRWPRPCSARPTRFRQVPAGSRDKRSAWNSGGFPLSGLFGN